MHDFKIGLDTGCSYQGCKLFLFPERTYVRPSVYFGRTFILLLFLLVIIYLLFWEKYLSGHNIRPKLPVRFCWAWADFSWTLSDDRQLFVALPYSDIKFGMFCRMEPITLALRV